IFALFRICKNEKIEPHLKYNPWGSISEGVVFRKIRYNRSSTLPYFDAVPYSHCTCFRCHFKIRELMARHSLSLRGLSWFVARRDAFSTFEDVRWGQSEQAACRLLYGELAEDVKDCKSTVVRGVDSKNLRLMNSVQRPNLLSSGDSSVYNAV